MYDEKQLLLPGRFSEVPIGSCFTSAEDSGNVYVKISDLACRVVIWTTDLDWIMTDLHNSFGGIASNVYKQNCLVDPDHEIITYNKYVSLEKL